MNIHNEFENAVSRFLQDRLSDRAANCIPFEIAFRRWFAGRPDRVGRAWRKKLNQWKSSAAAVHTRADLNAFSRPCFCVITWKISKQLSSPQSARRPPLSVSAILSPCAGVVSPLSPRHPGLSASLPKILKKIGENLKRPCWDSPCVTRG